MLSVLRRLLAALPRRRALSAVLLVLAGGLAAVPTAAEAYLYWGNFHTGNVLRASNDGTAINASFMTGMGNVSGLAVNDTHLFYGTQAGDRIGRASLDGTGRNGSFSIGTKDPYQMAVDGTHVYWAGFQGASAVDRAPLAGGAVQRVVPNAGSPVGFAMDSTYFYWSNVYTGTISRSRRDGVGGITASLISGASNPNGVAVNGSHIYWTNTNTGTIGRAKLDGTDVTQSLVSGGNQPWGITIRGSRVYWTNIGGGTIGRANLDGSDATQTFITGQSSPGPITTDLGSPGPRVTTAPAAMDGLLGSTFTRSGKFTDPNGEPLTMTASVGAVTTQPDGSFTWTYTPSAPTSGETVTIKATDSGGRSVTTSFLMTIPTPVMTAPSCLVRNANGTLAPFSISWTNLASSKITGTSYRMHVEKVSGRTAGDVLVGDRLIQQGQEYSHATTWAGNLSSSYQGVAEGVSPLYVNVRNTYYWNPVLLEKAVPVCNDTTPPVVSDTVTGPMGNFGWHTGNVGVSWLVTDGESAITSTTGCATSSITADTLGTSFACSATSLGGTTADSVEIKRDATPPVLSVPTAPIVVEATDPSGARAEFATTASDATSGLATTVCSPASGSAFAVGATSVTCTATDIAGNSTNGSFTVRVEDTIAPDFTVSDRSGEATGPSGLKLAFDAPTTTDAADGPGTATCTPASETTFALGDTTVTCTATDAAGNTRSRGFTVTVLDTTKPSLDVSGDKTAEATGPEGAKVEYAAPTAKDLVDGAPLATCDLASGHEFTIGTTKVTCRATDAAGNVAEGSFDVTVVDTTKPTLELPSARTVEATGPGGAEVVFVATATDLVDGARDVTCEPQSGSTFALGSTTVACSASDTRSNSVTDSFAVEVVDTTAPAVTAPDDTTVEATGPSGATVTFGTAPSKDAVGGAGEATCVPASDSTFAVGTTKVTCTETDDAGNTGSDAFDVTVEDTTKPALTVPEPVVTEATSAAGAVAKFAPATATDLVDGSTPATCDRTSGSQFAIGVTTVTCTVTDKAGNAAEASFSVTITNTRGPVFGSLPDRTLEATGPTGARSSFPASARDAVDGFVPVTCAPASGSTFAIGSTTVECSAKDSQGNETTDSFVMKVEDTAGPVISVPLGVKLEATGPSGAELEYANVSATDRVTGPAAVTCVPGLASTFKVGTTTVKCTSEDEVGNVSTRSFIVSVVDTTPPVVTVPDVVVNATTSKGVGVLLTGTARDLVSGALSVSCRKVVTDPKAVRPLPFALPGIVGLTIGSHEFVCTATDGEGNIASETMTVRVLSATQQAELLPLIVAGFQLTAPQAAPLVAKITNLVEYMNSRSSTKQPIRTVITPLENQIKAQTGTQPGKSLTPTQGRQLLTITRNIRTIVQPLKYSVGGTLTAPPKSQVTLRNNAGDAITIIAGTKPTSFTFPTEWEDDTEYSVTAKAAAIPKKPTPVCTVENGTGTIDDADVTDVVVTCE